MSYVYCIGEAESEFVKIGVAKSVADRLKSHQTSSPRKLSVIGVIPGSRREEAALHWLFADLHVRGEWFWNADQRIASWFAERGATLARSKMLGRVRRATGQSEAPTAHPNAGRRETASKGQCESRPLSRTVLASGSSTG